MAAMSEPTWEIPSDLRSQQRIPEAAYMWQKQGLWNVSAPDILQFDIIELNIYILRSLLLLGIKGGFDFKRQVGNTLLT